MPHIGRQSRSKGEPQLVAAFLPCAFDVFSVPLGEKRHATFTTEAQRAQ